MSKKLAPQWITLRLGNVCTKIGSGATPRGGSGVYLEQGDVALIRSQNVYNDGFHHDGLVYLTEKHADELANVEVAEGDILLNITGDSVARACQVDPDVLPARVNQHVAIIRSDPKRLCPLFLRYYLVSPLMQAYMLSLAGAGATRNALTKGMIESFEVPAPECIVEQQAIACILGTLDDKIELNRRRNRTLEAMARAIFESWFVDFDPVRMKCEEGRVKGEKRLPRHILDLFPSHFELHPSFGPIPAGWRVGTLGEMCDKPQYGYTASASDEEIGPRFLRITDINKNDWIEWENVPFCEIDNKDRSKYTLQPGDLVIARMADPGHGALIEERVEAVFASYLIRFRAKHAIFSRYLQYWVKCAAYWALVSSRQSGTTRANLNAQVLGSFTLLVPPNEILASFSRVIDALRKDLVASVSQSRTLAALRDTLLPKLISGELRVPDAERIVGRAT